MKVLQIVNIKKEMLAQVSWEPSGKLTLEVIDSSAEADLKAIIERGKQTGLPFRNGKFVEEIGLMVDGCDIVGVEHEKFLESLSEVIGQLKFGGQRVFGLIKQQSGEKA